MSDPLPHFNGNGPHRYEDGTCVYCGKAGEPAKLPTLDQLRLRHAWILKEQQALVHAMLKVINSHGDLIEKAKRLCELVRIFDEQLAKGFPSD